MYPVALGFDFQVEQFVSGTGVFDGTEQGRAGLTLGSGNAGVKFRAKVYGAIPNALQVQLVDTGAGTTTALGVAQLGTLVRVTLRRNAGGLLSTAAEVAAAVNAFGTFPPGYSQPMRATSTGNGTGVVAAAGPASFTGGLDPTLDPYVTQFEYVYGANTNGGLFYFENEGGIILRDLQANFPTIAPGISHMQFLRVKLDAGLNVVAGSGIPIFEADISPTSPSITATDVKVPLLPFQAIQVVFTIGSAGGTVRLIVRRDPSYPFL